jgi:hypothetical protein
LTDPRFFGGEGVRLGFFGPSRAEIEALSRDLIERHGEHAYDEAVYLSQIARHVLRSAARSAIYDQAAKEIRQASPTAQGDSRQAMG